MKNTVLCLLFILTGLSSCYKEKHAVITQLSGQYNCHTLYSGINYNPLPHDTIIAGNEVVAFNEVASYPRKMKLNAGGSDFTFMLSFDNLSFNADDKGGYHHLNGYFISDSVYFNISSTGKDAGLAPYYFTRYYAGIKL